MFSLFKIALRSKKEPKPGPEKAPAPTGKETAQPGPKALEEAGDAGNAAAGVAPNTTPKVAGEKPASAPVSSRRPQIPSIEGNPPTTINGRQFSGHAVDRMQGRGLFPSVIENAITPANRIGPGNTPGTSAYRDAINNIKVIVDDASGRVITVM